MPPKRKHSFSNKAGQAPVTKKAKQSVKDVEIKDEEENDLPLKLCWQWQSDEKEWKGFSSISEEAINDAYKAKKTQFTVEENGDDLVIHFSKMICINKTTSRKGKIRTGVTIGKDIFVWKWKDTQDEHVYTPTQMLTLEEAFQNGESPTVLKLGTRKYTLDFKAWTQTAITIKERKNIVRVKLDMSKKTKATKTKATKTTKTKATKTKTNAKRQKSTVSKEIVEKILFNGKRPVDSVCVQKLHSSHVYYEDDNVWDVTLNQTNLQRNNNKFYKIQLLEDNNSNSYCVWSRWGRVGQRGQCKLTECGTELTRAKTMFETKFFDKTGNFWNNEEEFEKKCGKYDILYVDYSSNEDKSKNIDQKPKQIPESKLDTRLKNLIEMVCNVKTMEEMVLEMKYDAKKAPLGKLTPDQIKAGYSSLKRIEGLINKNRFGAELIEACNEFYTRIPHCFGNKAPPLITTLPEVKQKIHLLEALGDIQIAIKLLNENPDMMLHPADNHYNSLKCDIVPLEKDSSDYTMVEKYLINTHGVTHNMYDLSIEGIFSCTKHGEDERFLDLGNRLLLWHGSRLTNWAGILGKGLRIAPPEAPISGYMFGKGLYFADMCSKSANYCFPTQTIKSGLLLLCEVSLGDCNELINAEPDADKLAPGKHSVKGKGRIIPNPKEILELPDGVKVPYGKGWDSKFVNTEGYTLNYNEYIVYNVNQVRMRYLISVKFNFKQ